MSRLSQLNPATLDAAEHPEQAALFASIKKKIGKVPNLYAAMATHNPAALSAMLAAGQTLAQSALPRKEQELINVLVSQRVGCDYCFAAHALLSKAAGWSDPELKLALAGQKTGDARIDALGDLIRSMLQEPGDISAEKFQMIRDAGFTDAQLVDIALTVATITFTNIFNRINNTDVDFPKPQ